MYMPLARLWPTFNCRRHRSTRRRRAKLRKTRSAAHVATRLTNIFAIGLGDAWRPLFLQQCLLGNDLSLSFDRCKRRQHATWRVVRSVSQSHSALRTENMCRLGCIMPAVACCAAGLTEKGRVDFRSCWLGTLAHGVANNTARRTNRCCSADAGCRIGRARCADGSSHPVRNTCSDRLSNCKHADH